MSWTNQRRRMVGEELLGLLIIQGSVDNHIITLIPVDGSYDLGENDKSNGWA